MRLPDEASQSYDPQIAVVRVEVTGAQYWVASSSWLVLGIKYLAAVPGGKVDVGESGKVEMRG